MATQQNYQEPLQASRLIPRHTFCELGTDTKTDGVAQFIDLRLPGNLSNCIRLQPAAFNSDTYKVEPNVSFKDEKGILNTKQCALTNFIRWRYAKGMNKDEEKTEDQSEKHKLETQVGLEFKTEAPKIESNTKVVEWSDGTKSLVIGDQIFEIQSEPVHRAQCFASYSKFQLLKGQISSKMIVKPSLRSHVMRRDDKAVDTEQEIKLTLAVEAKPDLMYDITDKNAMSSNAARNKQHQMSGSEQEADDFSEGSDDDDEPSVGEKRKYSQLGRVFNDNNDGADEKDSVNGGNGGVSRNTMANKRARMEASDEADEPVGKSLVRQVADDSDDDDEDVYRPGATIKMGDAPVNPDPQ